MSEADDRRDHPDSEEEQEEGELLDVEGVVEEDQEQGLSQESGEARRRRLLAKRDALMEAARRVEFDLLRPRAPRQPQGQLADRLMEIADYGSATLPDVGHRGATPPESPGSTHGASSGL